MKPKGSITMKKTFAALLALVMIACAFTAFAAEIAPMKVIDMNDLNECVINVAFTPDDVTESSIHVVVYEDAMYDEAEVSALAVGDTITYNNAPVVIKTIEEEDGVVKINGGDDEGGITLYDFEGGAYIAFEFETPAMIVDGEADFELADEVIYSHWAMDEDGAVLDEMTVHTAPAAELKALLKEEEADDFSPYNTVLTIEDNKVTEITVFFTP